LFNSTRRLLYTGPTRVAYERELKRFLDYCHLERGKTENSRIDKRDFRAYMEDRLAQGGKVTQFNKVRSAIAKFGALYGKYDSFHAMSKWAGREIRERKAAGLLRGPDRPHVSASVQQAAIDRLRHLDAKHEQRTGEVRGYALALELQKEGGLRSIEATERLTRLSLAGVRGEQGLITVLGKGGGCGRRRSSEASTSAWRASSGAPLPLRSRRSGRTKLPFPARHSRSAAGPRAATPTGARRLRTTTGSGTTTTAPGGSPRRRPGAGPWRMRSSAWGIPGTERTSPRPTSSGRAPSRLLKYPTRVTELMRFRLYQRPLGLTVEVGVECPYQTTC
jgi:hypothetical protein